MGSRPNGGTRPPPGGFLLMCGRHRRLKKGSTLVANTREIFSQPVALGGLGPFAITLAHRLGARRMVNDSARVEAVLLHFCLGGPSLQHLSCAAPRGGSGGPAHQDQ